MSKSKICTLTLFAWLGLVFQAEAQKANPFVFTPTNGKGPFPVILWLHGYRGYSPQGYYPGAKRDEMQKHADSIGAAIVGFPATTDLGDGTQKWTEEPATDYAYVQARLTEISKTNNFDLSRIALFGFSQGAMVAADLATIYPENFLGAVMMSPGGFSAPKVAKLRKPEHAKQVYFCFCGAEEHEANVGLTRYYARHLDQMLGAKVTLKLYPGVSKHARPADFMEKFPEWISAVLGGKVTAQ